jgi:hypothetical protein
MHRGPSAHIACVLRPWVPLQHCLTHTCKQSSTHRVPPSLHYPRPAPLSLDANTINAATGIQHAHTRTHRAGVSLLTTVTPPVCLGAPLTLLSRVRHPMSRPHHQTSPTIHKHDACMRPAAPGSLTTPHNAHTAAHTQSPTHHADKMLCLCHHAPPTTHTHAAASLDMQMTHARCA